MKKILIIKIGAIGDVIMALPVLTEIRVAHPDCVITWMCGKTVAPILKHISEIDNLIIVDEKGLFSKKIFVALIALFRLYNKIFLKRFDIILNYHIDSRYKLLDLFCICHKKFRFNRNSKRPIPIPGRSRSFEHIRLFQQHDKESSLNIVFPNFNVRTSSRNLDLFDENTVVLAPGGANNLLREQSLRRWPIDYYRQLAKYLISKGKNVIIVGAETDKWIIPYFENLKLTALINKLDLVELIQAFSKCSVVITHDSGPFHLAVFAQKPHVIGLFGPTNPNEFLYGTKFDSKLKIIWNARRLFCSPCYYGKYFSKNCKNNICMQYITVEQVIEEFENNVHSLN
jgi:ADP-heptose:LPS heptosyltransferase